MAVSPDDAWLRDVIEVLSRRVAALEQAMAARTLAPPLPGRFGRARMPEIADPERVEARVGGYWFARLGIVSLVTGVALLVAHGFDDLPPAAKAGLGYASAGALAWVGHQVARRFRAFGQILFAGGLGIAYYTSYALHHVPAVKLIDGPELGFAFLAANVVAIVAVAQRMQSETVAGVALFLGLHTGMVSEVGTFTLLSGCLLAGGAAFFLVRNRWVIVPLSTMVAVYSTHAGWMLGNPLGSGDGIVHTAGHLATSLGFLAVYFATFTLALAIATRELSDTARAAFAVINAAAAATLASYELAYHATPGLEWCFAGLAAVSLAMAAIGLRRHGRDRAFHTHLAVAAASSALAAWVVLSGSTLAIVWSGVAAAFAATAIVLRSRPLSLVASAVTALALGLYVWAGTDDPAVAAALVASIAIHERLLSLVPSGPLADSWRRLERWLGPAAIGAVLLTVTRATLSPSTITVAWVACATALFAAGLALRAIGYRLAALGAFAIAFVRLFLVDLGGLSAAARIVAFLVLGALLLAVSFVYTRRTGPRASGLGPPVPDRANVGGSEA